MSALARVWQGLRVVLGVGRITLVLLVVVLEAMHALYHLARRTAWGNRPIFDSAEHPFWNESWYAGWEHRVNVLAAGSGYDPYRGWRVHPTSSPDPSIDSRGARLTITSAPPTP